MKWPEFSRPILAAHSGRPQEIAMLTQALRGIEDGLAVLARHGHIFGLVSGPGTPPPAWPRTLFHIHLAPNGRVVRDEGEYNELGPGWYDTMEAAQHASGMDTQMALRGGLPRQSRALVAVEPLRSVYEIQAEKDFERVAARERGIAERNMRNGT